ncbi:hypothetical protein RIR_jg32690.t1 [Rhizophagus irregularis DAOM 181602=DAOM 197198]|nr:hypothetical protein RIR_jg32690.t1 [Rhizophagus irregularis DAOM 181602=DAOM 197198]
MDRTNLIEVFECYKTLSFTLKSQRFKITSPRKDSLTTEHNSLYDICGMRNVLKSLRSGKDVFDGCVSHL